MPRRLEMPRPFRLGAIRIRRHITAQLLPIRLARTTRAWALVGDAVRLEPAVHAGLPHLEPPSRFGLAATPTHTIHHPLTQVDCASHAPYSPKALFRSIGNCGLGYSDQAPRRQSSDSQVPVRQDLPALVEFVKERCPGRNIQLQDLFFRQLVQLHHQSTEAVAMRCNDDGFSF